MVTHKLVFQQIQLISNPMMEIMKRLLLIGSGESLIWLFEMRNLPDLICPRESAILELWESVGIESWFGTGVKVDIVKLYLIITS